MKKLEEKKSVEEDYIERILSIQYMKVLDTFEQMQEVVDNLEGQIKREKGNIDTTTIAHAKLFVEKTKQEAKEKIEDIRSGNVSPISNEKIQKESMDATTSNKEDGQSKYHRIQHWIKLFLFYGTLMFGLITVFLFTSNQSVSQPPRSIFGYAPMTVLSRSMDSEIPKDSLIIAKTVNPDTISIGDDITFLKENNTTITHRVIGIYENYQGTGERGFQTQGVDNASPDTDIVIAKNVVGKVVFHNLLMGQSLLLIKENVIIVFVLVVLTIGFISSFNKYRYIKKLKEFDELKV